MAIPKVSSLLYILLIDHNTHKNGAAYKRSREKYDNWTYPAHFPFRLHSSSSLTRGRLAQSLSPLQLTSAQDSWNRWERREKKKAGITPNPVNKKNNTNLFWLIIIILVKSRWSSQKVYTIHWLIIVESKNCWREEKKYILNTWGWTVAHSLHVHSTSYIPFFFHLFIQRYIFIPPFST